MKKSITAIIFALSIIIASIVLGNAFMNRNRTQRNISVTGLGSTDLTSDLIVWEAHFSRENTNLKEAYSDLENDKKVISQYLTEKGMPKENIVFSAVSTLENMESKYSANGNFLGSEFKGYTLSQNIQLNSKDVEKVEVISREITELLNTGVQLYSETPRYYYTKIEDLKIEMISRATENARLRAEKIAENSGADLGKLLDAKMGIFQITGQNSEEEYSWGGTYNTSSKAKTTSITMKLTYNLD